MQVQEAVRPAASDQRFRAASQGEIDIRIDVPHFECHVAAGILISARQGKRRKPGFAAPGVGRGFVRLRSTELLSDPRDRRGERFAVLFPQEAAFRGLRDLRNKAVEGGRTDLQRIGPPVIFLIRQGETVKNAPDARFFGENDGDAPYPQLERVRRTEAAVIRVNIQGTVTFLQILFGQIRQKLLGEAEVFQLPGDKKWNDNMLSLLRFYDK